MDPILIHELARRGKLDAVLRILAADPSLLNARALGPLWQNDDEEDDGYGELEWDYAPRSMPLYYAACLRQEHVWWRAC